MEFDRIPRITKYLSVIMMFAWIGRSTVWNFLPVFFESQMESVFLIGFLTSIPAMVPLLLDIPAGNLVQRAGEKLTIFMGFLAALFSPVLYLTGLVPLFFVAKAFEGVGKTLIWNGGWSLTLKSSDSEVESENVSVFLLGINISLVIGPVVGGFLLASYGFNLLFGLWAVCWMLSVILYYIYVGTERGSESLKEALNDLERRKTYRDDWKHLKNNWVNLRKVFSLAFLYSVIFSFYWLAIPLLLDKMNADYSTMGIVFGVAAVPKLFQFAFGDMADRIGWNTTIRMLSLLLLPVLIALSLTESLLMIGGLFLLARILSTGISPAVHAKYDSSVPDDVEGEMTGFYELAKHSGQTIGPIAAGAIASVWSLSASFLGAAFIALMLFLVSSLDF
jgi:MFS family permease